MMPFPKYLQSVITLVNGFAAIKSAFSMPTKATGIWTELSPNPTSGDVDTDR
jgi:hypothetical protein